MCGIVGELAFEQHSVCERTTQERMVELMRRRGPDDAGIWRDAQRCFLGFRRLAILDLSPSGHQPMVTKDGRYVLVFNGEVYNFQDLRTKLCQCGIICNSTGDSEVVLRSLIKWGKRALSLFNGMFALALYDKLEKTILLARDPFGIKPLYLMRSTNGVVFASQYDQLLCHPLSRRLAVSRRSLATYLRLGYIPAPLGILSGTHMLSPGNWIEFGADGRESNGEYFSFPSVTEPSLTGESAFEAVDAAVSNAVGRQLVSDVPVGAFLSGGVDSPLVTAKMHSQQVNGHLAFTIGTDDQKSDESQAACKYAEQLGVNHIIEYCTEDVSLSLVDDVVAASSEPFADFSMFPTMMVSRLARQHVKVALSGDGGDELFWGYFGRFASVLQVCEQFSNPHWRRDLSQRSQRVLGIAPYHFGLRQPNIGEWYRAKHERIPAPWIARIFPELYKESHEAMFEYSGWEKSPTALWMRWNEIVGHLTMVLLKVDRASMYESLEVRVPLLDQEVVDVALRVDWRTCLKLDQGLGKVPLRRSLARHIQSQTISKKGFTVPMGKWMKGPLKPMLEDLVLSRTELLGSAMNRSAVRELVSENQRGLDRGWALWVLLSLALWEMQHYRRSF